MLACIGLNLVSGITTFVGAMLALSVYALGKTFFWPTMLAVASDRFPRTGAVAISHHGRHRHDVGRLGRLRWAWATRRTVSASEALQQTSPAVYAEYKVEQPKGWLFLSEVQAH